MNQEKRSWQVVTEDDEEDRMTASASSTSTEKKDKSKEKTYEVTRSALKEALGKQLKPEDEETYVKITPSEVLVALPHMSHNEKKAVKLLMQKESENEAWETYARFRPEVGRDEAGQPSGARGSGHGGYPERDDGDQRPPPLTRPRTIPS